MPKFKKQLSEQIDKRLLALLKSDGRSTLEELARELSLSPSTVYNRIRGMQKRGVIKGYTVILDRNRAGLGTGAVLLITIDGQANVEKVSRALCGVPEVEAVYEIGGEADIVVLVYANAIEDLRNLVNERINSIPGVSNVTPLVILKTYKENGILF